MAITTIKNILTPQEKIWLEAKRAELAVKERYGKEIKGTPLETRPEPPKEVELPVYRSPSSSATLESRIKHSSEWTGLSISRTKQAVEFITNGLAVDVNDMKALQAGWPELFGTPPIIDPEISEYHNNRNVLNTFKQIDMRTARQKILDEDSVEKIVEKADIPKVLKEQFQKAIEATGVTPERVEETLDAVKHGYILTALDKDILKAGFPEMLDKQGRVMAAEFERGIKAAMKVINASRDRVEEAIHKANTFKYLVEKDKKILQAGWPTIFGFPGTKFKRGQTIDDAPIRLGGQGTGIKQARAARTARYKKEEDVKKVSKKTTGKKIDTETEIKTVKTKKEEKKQEIKEYQKKQQDKPYPTGFKLVDSDTPFGPKLVYENEPVITAKQLKELTPEWILDAPEPEIEGLYDPNADQLYEAIKYWFSGKERYTKSQFEMVKREFEKGNKIPEVYPMPILTKKQMEDVKERHPVIHGIISLIKTGKVVSQGDIDRMVEEGKFIKRHKLPLDKKKYPEKFPKLFQKYRDGGRLTKDEIGVLQFYDPKTYGFYGEKFKDPREPKKENIIPVGSKEDIEIALKKVKVEHARLTDDEKLILQSNFPDLYGIPGKSFQKPKKRFTDYAKESSRVTGASLKEIMVAIKKVVKDKKSPNTREKEILQAGWPHIFGKLGENFKEGGHQVIPEVLPPAKDLDAFLDNWFVTKWFPGELERQGREVERHLERMNKSWDRRAKRYILKVILFRMILGSPQFENVQQANEGIPKLQKEIAFRRHINETVLATEKQLADMEKMMPRTLKLPKEAVDYINHGGTPPTKFDPTKPLETITDAQLDKAITPEVSGVDSLYDKYLQGWPDSYSEDLKIVKNKIKAIEVKNKLHFKN